MNIIDNARKLRNAMMYIASALDDVKASTAPDMFPRMKYDGSLIRSGTRINWHGHLKRAAVDIWDNVDSNPGNAPELWEDISYREGYRIIPATVTATLAFSAGERGWWGDTLYCSTMDGNVYTPAQYPDGWETV